MLGSLRDFAPRIKAWSMDRSEEQVEGERLLEQHDYSGAELHLIKAILERFCYGWNLPRHSESNSALPTPRKIRRS